MNVGLPQNQFLHLEIYCMYNFVVSISFTFISTGYFLCGNTDLLICKVGRGGFWSDSWACIVLFQMMRFVVILCHNMFEVLTSFVCSRIWHFVCTILQVIILLLSLYQCFFTPIILQFVATVFLKSGINQMIRILIFFVIFYKYPVNLKVFLIVCKYLFYIFVTWRSLLDSN